MERDYLEKRFGIVHVHRTNFKLTDEEIFNNLRLFPTVYNMGFTKKMTSHGAFYWPKDSSPILTSILLKLVDAPGPSLLLKNWRRIFDDYPDREFINEMFRCIEEGFTMGYTGPRTTHTLPERKYKELELNQIMEEYRNFKNRGWLIGPFRKILTGGPFYFNHENPTFTVPKKNTTERRRIDHFSYPPGNSVNDFIDNTEFPVHFASYDMIREAIANAPRGCRMSVRDVRHCYPHLLLHPCDWPLTMTNVKGIMKAKGFRYTIRITFGGKSYPSLCDRTSQCTKYAIVKLTPIKKPLNILDDYWFLHLPDVHGRIKSDEIIQEELDKVDKVFKDLGWQLHPKKSLNNKIELEWLGLIWNVVNKTVKLPEGKTERYLKHVKEIISYGKRRFPIKKLHSLLGKLVYVAIQVTVGRSRLFYLFGCLKAAQVAIKLGNKRTGFVSLSGYALDDLMWWANCLTYTGRPRTIIPRTFLKMDYCVTTDAATSDGIGCWWKGRYFSFECTELGKSKSIVFLELLSLVVACLLWGRSWANNRIFWRTDCECHVRGLFKIRTKSPDLLPLHNQLDDLQWKLDFIFDPRHIKGVNNNIADGLSRSNCIEAKKRGWEIYPLNMLDVDLMNYLDVRDYCVDRL